MAGCSKAPNLNANLDVESTDIDYEHEVNLTIKIMSDTDTVLSMHEQLNEQFMVSSGHNLCTKRFILTNRTSPIVQMEVGPESPYVIESKIRIRKNELDQLVANIEGIGEICFPDDDLRLEFGIKFFESISKEPNFNSDGVYVGNVSLKLK